LRPIEKNGLSIKNINNIALKY